MKVSVVLPARNEEKLIKDTVLDIVQYLRKKKYPFEIIVVVNGSFDKTEEIVNNLSKKHRQIKKLKSKPGYGFALRKGLREARGEYIVVFNVDFYDLKLIDLVDIEMYGKDLIIGSKRAHWSQDNRAFKRKLISMLFNWYLRIIYGFKGSDTHGIKILKREVLKKVLSKCKITSGIFDTEFVIRAQEMDFQIADFPVKVREKRPPRFSNRLLETPKDIYNLFKALQNYEKY